MPKYVIKRIRTRFCALGMLKNIFLVPHLRHLYSKDASDVLVDERFECVEVVLFDCPIFTSPEEDVDDVLNEDLMF